MRQISSGSGSVMSSQTRQCNAKAPSEKAPRGVATDNEARALAILDAEPGITGAELARRLDVSSRQGQRLLSRLNRPAPTHTS